MRLIQASRPFRLALVAVLMASTVSAGVAWPLAAEDGEANRLFVEAVNNVRRAEALPIRRAHERAELFGKAALILAEIVGTHPSSDIAVKLVSDEPIGDITVRGIAVGGVLAQAATCVEELDTPCLLNSVDGVVAELTDAGEADWIQNSRAWIFAKLGNFTEARQAADAIGSRASKAEALSYLAGWRAAYGDRQAAQDLLRDAEGNVRGGTGGLDLIGALSEMAWATAKLGELERARELWREAGSASDALVDKYDQLIAKDTLAADKLDAGAIAEAEVEIAWLDRQLTDDGAIREYRAQTLDVGDMINHSFFAARAKVLASLHYSTVGRVTDAARSVSTVEQLMRSSGHLRTDAWLQAKLAAAQSKVGRVADALATAQSISTAEHKAYGFLWIAESQFSANDRDAARETLFTAFGAAAGLDSLDGVAGFVVDVASALN